MNEMLFQNQSFVDDVGHKRLRSADDRESLDGGEQRRRNHRSEVCLLSSSCIAAIFGDNAFTHSFRMSLVRGSELANVSNHK